LQAFKPVRNWTSGTVKVKTTAAYALTVKASWLKSVIALVEKDKLGITVTSPAKHQNMTLDSD